MGAIALMDVLVEKSHDEETLNSVFGYLNTTSNLVWDLPCSQEYAEIYSSSTILDSREGFTAIEELWGQKIVTPTLGDTYVINQSRTFPFREPSSDRALALSMRRELIPYHNQFGDEALALPRKLELLASQENFQTISIPPDILVGQLVCLSPFFNHL